MLATFRCLSAALERRSGGRRLWYWWAQIASGALINKHKTATNYQLQGRHLIVFFSFIWRENTLRIV